MVDQPFPLRARAGRPDSLGPLSGFEAFWAVLADRPDAVSGEWVPGPGAPFFEAVERELGSLPAVAENLGWITPAVEDLRKRFDFPGMGVLQFAFGSDPQASDFIPHNHTQHMVIYSGTHDNDTTMGWWKGGDEETRTRKQMEKERDLARRYLAADGRNPGPLGFSQGRYGFSREIGAGALAGHFGTRFGGQDEHARTS